MPVRSKSAKKASPLETAKAEAAAKQEEIEMLDQEAANLKLELQKHVEEVDKLRGKLLTILPEILTHRDRERFPLEPVNDPTDIDAEYVREMVYMMVDDLYVKRSRKGMVEQRIEDLETKVTEQSLKYQNIVMKNLACLSSLEEALDARTPQDMQKTLKSLRRNLVADNNEDNTIQPVSARKLPPRSTRSSHTLDIIKEMQETPFPLAKPLRRQSGDTHIRYLIPEIHRAVCNELSLEKYTGADWRRFALMVGVSTETIQFWRRLKIRNPMEQVLTFWKDSKAATVRMLHRHLRSPQINALLPAKLLSDFYHVD